MTVGLGAPSAKRFDPEKLFHPGSIAVSGSQTAMGREILETIRAAGFAGAIGTDEAPIADADAAIVADDAADVPAALAAHAARGVRGAVVLSAVDDLGAIARAARIRVLGPHSYGMMLPGLHFNASRMKVMPPAGRVALVGQSASLARTVIDWAVPNSVGFSHVIGIGGNTDIGFGLVLDHLSRDPGTGAILVQIDRLRDPRIFQSAARAAARLRPVVALAPGARMRDPDGTSHAAYEAAFSRAGVLLTETLGEFLAAAETLTRVRPAHHDTLAILSNSVSAGRLAADCAIARGVKLATIPPEAGQVVGLALGAPLAPGPIYTGRGNPTRLAEIAAMLAACPEIGGILVVHAPTGGDDHPAIEALVACAKTVRIPLLIAAMGESHGLEHRHRLSQAGLACFDTPEGAITGFRQLIRNRQNRAAARELPPSKVLKIAPDTPAAQARIAAARQAGRATLVQDDALAVIAAYKIPILPSRAAGTPEEAAMLANTIGFPVVVKLSHPDMPTNRIAGSIALDLPDGRAVREAIRAIQTRLTQRGDLLPGAKFLVQHQAPRGQQLRIRVADHPILGPTLGFGAGGGDPDDFSSLAIELPPLNLPLAQALIDRAPIAPLLAAHRGQPACDREAIAATLVRVSQLIIDLPDIALLDLDPLFAHETGIVAASARITLRGEGERRPNLLISPYPAELTAVHEAKGKTYTLRPIRPEDADQHAAMFTRLTPEDIRFRFFSAMRSLSAEQISRMTDVDYGREMAIIAVDDATGETAGVARLVRNDTDGASAEFAVVVEPAAKGRGLASALMRAIIAWGKSQGVAEINGQILADNQPMLAFIKRLGFSVRRIPGEADVLEAILTP
jgi:acetyltransferase